MLERKEDMPHDCLGPQGKLQLAERRWVWVWEDQDGDNIVISGSTEFEVLVGHPCGPGRPSQENR